MNGTHGELAPELDGTLTLVGLRWDGVDEGLRLVDGRRRDGDRDGDSCEGGQDGQLHFSLIWYVTG